ncbi:MAG: hypothetical protein ACLPN1_08770 [Dissulfurispiraceae bacterium]
MKNRLKEHQRIIGDCSRTERGNPKTTISQEVAKIIDSAITEEYYTPTNQWYQGKKARSSWPIAATQSEPFIEDDINLWYLKCGRVVSERIDLMVTDKNRGIPLGCPWLSVYFDAFEKRAVGMDLGFTPPDDQTVMNCLIHSMKPKKYVRQMYPQIVHSWNACSNPEVLFVEDRKFYSKRLIDSCMTLGILLQYAKQTPYTYSLHFIETFFHKLTQFIHSQLKPDNQDVIDFHTLSAIIHAYIIDIHNQEESCGIAFSGNTGNVGVGKAAIGNLAGAADEELTAAGLEAPFNLPKAKEDCDV